MEAQELSFEGSSVPTLLGSSCGAEMQRELAALRPQPDKFFVCSEQAIVELCGGLELFTRSALGAPVEFLYMGKGEEAKSAETLLQMTQQCFEHAVSKRSVIVAFGGGVVLNVVGLMAALIYRGIRLVHVPTTLMAQHDVITSQKTAVNLCGRKNNLGTYYASCLNLVDVGFLRTLPESQYMSGLGELCKNALILGGEHRTVFETVMRQRREGGSGTPDARNDIALVKVGIKAKAQLLEVDAREKTGAMIFEYGHTTAHALERSFADEVLPHGSKMAIAISICRSFHLANQGSITIAVAVCWGMLTCSFVAERMGIMSASERKAHDAIIELMGLELPEPRPSIESIMEKLMRDSKRGLVMESDDEASEVLLKEIGTPLQSKTMLHPIPAQLVREWLTSVGFTSAAG